MLAISRARKKVIDLKKALQFPLDEVPLSLCNPDGCMRKTNKGKLGQIVMKEIDTTETLEVKKEHTAYIVDFMALIRTITKITDTFERFAWKMVSYIPKGYGRIDFVADCYFENSIKASERFKRIYQLKLSLNLVKSKIPRDYVETHSYYVEKIKQD